MSEPNDPLLNTIVAGRYRILRLLGEGGMGRVYLAEHEAIEKTVALKVLRPEYSTKPEIVARFQQEAISASRIKHPHVLDVFDFGRVENGCFFLAMEFLEGHDLADELVEHRTIAPQRGVKIALQVCRALSAAHGRGVVHRDLKPENVFLQRTADGDEMVKIVDFGIAQLRTPEEAAASEPKRRRLTRTGMIFGTPEYMAPEQAGGKNADGRVDVYALGVIMYEMFTGAVPFTGETFLQVLSHHLNESAPAMKDVCPDLHISRELEAVVMKALAKNPLERHPSMIQLGAAILGTPEGRAVDAAGARTSMPEFAATHAAGVRPGGSAPTHAIPHGVPTAEQFGTAGAASPRTAPEPGAPHSTPTLSDGSPGTQPSFELRPASEGESAAPSGGKSAIPLVAVFGGLGALGVAGALTLFVLKPHSGERRAAADTSAAAEKSAPALSAPPQSSAASAVTAPAASASSPPSATIRLSVETEPQGAVLLKNGFQVCDTTPCEVLVKPDETVELEAQKASLRGKAKVLAQSDQRVKIPLAVDRSKHSKSQPKGLCVKYDEQLGIMTNRPCD